MPHFHLFLITFSMSDKDSQLREYLVILTPNDSNYRPLWVAFLTLVLICWCPFYTAGIAANRTPIWKLSDPSVFITYIQSVKSISILFSQKLHWFPITIIMGQCQTQQQLNMLEKVQSLRTREYSWIVVMSEKKTTLSIQLILFSDFLKLFIVLIYWTWL